jgi:hypothetical protein
LTRYEASPRSASNIIPVDDVPDAHASSSYIREALIKDRPYISHILGRSHSILLQWSICGETGPSWRLIDMLPMIISVSPMVQVKKIEGRIGSLIGNDRWKVENRMMKIRQSRRNLT